jgi:hypothetical protein
MSAKPFFIISSGRSGTAMMVKALAAADDVTIEHEYMVNLVQPLAVKRYQGLVSEREARTVLESAHGAALRYASTSVWGDSSNKLSWLIPELTAHFPEARFVHLVRDGRKVASSYFHKLFAECYDDRSSAILSAYLAAPNTIPAPPPEKKYWWPQPKSGDPLAHEFPWFDQFQRICWHWSEINRVILKDLEHIPASRKLFLRLEDLRAQPSLVAELFAFLGLKFRDEHFAVFARPHNVNRPIDKMLTAEQSAHFARMCQPMMERLGYGERAEYAVNY